MGSGGLEMDGGDGYSAARLNQKTTFVGTGAQISGLSTTYPGMMAFCTSTGSGFTADYLYQRNAADSAWTVIGIVTISEQSSTPVTDDADFTVTAGHRYYAFLTLPTTEALYVITGIEWKNGATVAGNITAGVDIIDADPPTLANTVLAANSAEVAQSGTSAVQRVSQISSQLLPGGTIIGIWVHCSSSSATLREETGAASQNQRKSTSYDSSPPTQETTAWTAATTRKYLKLYYKGYS